MIQSPTFRIAEFFALFVLLPVSLCLEYLIAVKAGLVLLGFVYVVILLTRDAQKPLKPKTNRPWKPFLKRLGIQFIIVAVVTSLYVMWQQPSALFCVPKNNLGLWVGILGVYTFLSVWPQELIYRTFFFSRYETLFKNKALFIFLNAIVFSLAHLFFRNTLVLVLTFIGGILFGITYLKTKSTLFVSVEHALYGNWLFTVGMGEMLAFPGMEAC